MSENITIHKCSHMHKFNNISEQNQDVQTLQIELRQLMAFKHSLSCYDMCPVFIYSEKKSL